MYTVQDLIDELLQHDPKKEVRVEWEHPIIKTEKFFIPISGVGLAESEIMPDVMDDYVVIFFSEPDEHLSGMN
jgi:hypothetical protein